MKYLLPLLLIIGLAGCDKFDSKPVDSDKTIIQYQVEQQQLELESRKIDTALRQQVMKICVDHGKIPVLFNGNIDCKSVN